MKILEDICDINTFQVILLRMLAKDIFDNPNEIIIIPPTKSSKN